MIYPSLDVLWSYDSENESLLLDDSYLTSASNVLREILKILFSLAEGN